VDSGGARWEDVHGQSRHDSEGLAGPEMSDDFVEPRLSFFAD
jgi:hypothetical protein